MRRTETRDGLEPTSRMLQNRGRRHRVYRESIEQGKEDSVNQAHIMKHWSPSDHHRRLIVWPACVHIFKDGYEIVVANHYPFGIRCRSGSVLQESEVLAQHL